MIIGTPYFLSRTAAYRYYREYGVDERVVSRKIMEGEIHIGKPELKPNQRLRIVDKRTRYAIEDVIPMRNMRDFDKL